MVLLFILVGASVGVRSGMFSVGLPKICFGDIAGDGVTISV